MEYYKEKYRVGAIDLKTYDKMMEIVAHLEQNEYRYIESIGDGAYGSVIKIKHVKTDEKMAAKIVEKKYISDGEIILWKTLNHQNILPLNDMQFAYYADSYIFFTPLYPMTLEQKVLDLSFISKKSALKQGITWLKEILDAVVYLHDKGLSHNDIKCNNVFISSAGTAVLADFGFLTAAEKPIRKYGAPLIYRCPEGYMTEDGLTEIDGQMLDIWTVGMLAFEMLTKMSLLTEVLKHSNSLSYWFTDIYPILQNRLQKENFINLMKGAFPNSKNVDQKADDITNFIISCLNVIPGRRPAARQLQEHKVFGGVWKNVISANQVDIWEKRVNIKEFNAILEQNKLETVPEYLLEENYNSQFIENNKPYTGEKQSENLSNPIISHKYIIEEKLSDCQSEFSKNDIDENHLLDDSPTFAKNKQVSLATDKKNDHDVMPHPAPTNRLSSTVSTNHVSLNIPDLQKSENLKNDFDFDLSDISQVVVSASPSFTSSHSSNHKNSNKSGRCKIFRKWWKDKKSTVCKMFTACFCCGKKNNT